MSSSPNVSESGTFSSAREAQIPGEQPFPQHQSPIDDTKDRRAFNESASSKAAEVDGAKLADQAANSEPRIPAVSKAPKRHNGISAGRLLKACGEPVYRVFARLTEPGLKRGIGQHRSRDARVIPSPAESEKSQLHENGRFKATAGTNNKLAGRQHSTYQHRTRLSCSTRGCPRQRARCPYL